MNVSGLFVYTQNYSCVQSTKINSGSIAGINRSDFFAVQNRNSDKLLILKPIIIKCLTQLRIIPASSEGCVLIFHVLQVSRG
jgi:hypothetical protein